MHALQRLSLDIVLRNDPFPRVGVPDVVAFAEIIQEVLAADAEGCFEGVGRIVDARVDDLAVAGGRFGPDGGVAF